MDVDRSDALVDADPDTGTYRATYHWPGRPPSIAVALALMEITDSNVTDLDPIYEATNVNPDALDDLFGPSTAGRGPNSRVRFTYHRHTVTVNSYGRIVIHSPTAAADPSSRDP